MFHYFTSLILFINNTFMVALCSLNFYVHLLAWFTKILIITRQFANQYSIVITPSKHTQTSYQGHSLPLIMICMFIHKPNSSGLTNWLSLWIMNSQRSSSSCSLQYSPKSEVLVAVVDYLYFCCTYSYYSCVSWISVMCIMLFSVISCTNV